MAKLPEPVFDPAEVRRVVDEVLSRPEYADLQPGLIDRMLNAVMDQIGRALSTLEGTGFGTALGVVVLLAALALAGWLIVRFLGRVRRDPTAGVAVADQVGRSRDDWLADADRHEQEGRLRDAVRCRYRALVALLAERGVLEEVPGRTTGEYLEEVRQQAPRAARPFAAVTSAFEVAWYGRGEVTVADLERLRTAEQAAAGALASRADVPQPVAAGARAAGGGADSGGAAGDGSGARGGGGP